MRATWARTLDRDVEGLEHPCCEPFFLAQQAEKDVLRPDVVVLQRPRLVLSQDDNPSGSFSESFEHSLPRPPSSLDAGRR